MDEIQAVDNDQVYSLAVNDPTDLDNETLIIVKSTDETMAYHSQLARYLANQCDRLIPHFYSVWRGVSRANLQVQIQRMRQSVKPHEEATMQAHLAKSFSQWVAEARLKRIKVNGTLVVVIFGMPGIDEPVFNAELMIPFNNLQIASDIANTECDPAYCQAA
ncbi:hypothetical protein RBE51_21395 [Pseudomonas taiwanensis]|uniref:hypothetical protein n=1 Tax=Pseudomonas taiwanensis TaxID=470150 RepID=UPI0028DD8295|nr:hypothetical protein [Pseudomonas taiwanensis]MDT8925354.1 hypothetical protein [Pseudomonas taiwanensis]